MASNEQTVNMSTAIAVGSKTDSVLMDLYIHGTGSPSSFDIYHDTDVSIPLLSGPTHVEPIAQNVQYDIENLDPDVVDVLLGEFSFGVDDVHSFHNNGDGTGSILVDFDPLVVPRRLSIIAHNDVDNESLESSSIAVFLIEGGTLNHTLSLVPQRMVWTDTCDRLVESIPETDFIHRAQFNVPFSFNLTAFELRSVVPGVPVRITVIREENTQEESQLTVVPVTKVHMVNLSLGKGRNTIIVSDGEREYLIFVVAAHYASIHCAYAREIFNFSQNIIEEQQRAISSPISTRLAEPYLNFTENLPEIRSLQVLSTKLGVKTLMNASKTQGGVRDFLAALTLSTPVFNQQVNQMENFDPSVYPLHYSVEDFSGVEAHVWFQNTCIDQWLAFLRYIDNLDAFQILSITEKEIVLRDDNGILSSHRFDFHDSDCSLVSRIENELCFSNVAVSVSLEGQLTIDICAAQYPFDLVARSDGQHAVPPVDGEDGEGGLDPGFDNLSGFSVTRRFDSGLSLDSFGPKPAINSGYDDCVFQSYIVRPHVLASSDITDDRLSLDAEASGAFENKRPASTMIDAVVGVENTKSTDLELLLAGENNLAFSMDVAVSEHIESSCDINVYVSDLKTRMVNMDVNVVD